MIKILFIHHSTGASFIQQGNIRQKLHTHFPDVSLYDQGYIKTGKLDSLKFIFHPSIYGFRNWEGKIEKENIQVPNNNTDPDGLEKLFTASPEPFQEMLGYDVIMFKSCFPVTKILTDKQLETYIKEYEHIRDVCAKHPENIFLPFSPPPLRMEMTNKEAAKRARFFADWLMSDTFTQNYPNIHPYNFFDYLAQNDGKFTNTLKRKYCKILPFDSHPNRVANMDVSNNFINFLEDILK